MRRTTSDLSFKIFCSHLKYTLELILLSEISGTVCAVTIYQFRNAFKHSHYQCDVPVTASARCNVPKFVRLAFILTKTPKRGELVKKAYYAFKLHELHIKCELSQINEQHILQCIQISHFQDSHYRCNILYLLPPHYT